jgi:hypothetical protein
MRWAPYGFYLSPSSVGAMRVTKAFTEQGSPCSSRFQFLAGYVELLGFLMDTLATRVALAGSVPPARSAAPALDSWPKKNLFPQTLPKTVWAVASPKVDRYVIASTRLFRLGQNRNSPGLAESPDGFDSS